MHPREARLSSQWIGSPPAAWRSWLALLIKTARRALAFSGPDTAQTKWIVGLDDRDALSGHKNLGEMSRI